MQLWNLSSLDALETPVLTNLGHSAAKKRYEKSPQITTSSVKTVMRVAALAAISYSVVVCGSAKFLTMPHSATNAVCNVDSNRPPLEALFGGRFNDQWTQAREDQLLAEAVKKSASPVGDRDFLNLVHTAQHESLSEDAPRLAEGDIRKLTRRKA